MDISGRLSLVSCFKKINYLVAKAKFSLSFIILLQLQLQLYLALEFFSNDINIKKNTRGYIWKRLKITVAYS